MTDTTDWDRFCAISSRRRAIRDFDGRPLDEGVVRAVLEETLLAPSSGNLQPFVIHRVRAPALRAAIAEACEGQRAARSASELLVFVASPNEARRTLRAQRQWVDAEPSLAASSRGYHRKQLSKFERFLRLAPLSLMGLARVLWSAVSPARTLVPLGPSGIRNWAARSAIYAAQQCMLAAAAHHLDTCPMEGFDPVRVARLLGLERGAVVPLVVALGHRTADAHLERRWRRPFDAAIVTHA